MKLRVPLFARILGWFFLNLALLAVGFALLMRAQFVFDRDFLLTAGAAERLDNLGQEIVSAVKDQPHDHAEEVVSRYGKMYGVRFHVFDPTGRPLAGEPTDVPPEVRDHIMHRPPPMGRPPPQPPPPPPRETGDGNPSRILVRAGNPPRYWAVVRTPSQFAVMIESHSLTGGGLFLDLRPWIVAVFGAGIFSALFWLPFVRGITRSIAQMTQATQQIAEGRFYVRVKAHRRDELGALGHAINGMAQRLDGFVTGQKRFLSDIAHELCSPLARLRVALGILEERADPREQPDVARANEPAEEIAGLVNELLSFSKASLSAAHITLQAVSLREIADTAIRREINDGARLKVNIAPDLRVEAEPELLTRALANLLRNAVRYAGTAGPISISAERKNEGVAVTVADQGPGIPAAELPRIFDPFYRLDASRDRQTGGVGLGLAIVKTCVEACQGTVVAANCLPTGLQVTITLRAA